MSWERSVPCAACGAIISPDDLVAHTRTACYHDECVKISLELFLERCGYGYLRPRPPSRFRQAIWRVARRLEP